MHTCFALFPIAIGIFCAFVDTADAQPKDSTSHVRPEHGTILQKWLAHKKELRLATENDVIDGYKESLEYMRHEDKNYHPFYAVGDFNQDGAQDFAVVFINRDSSSKNLTVAIFNGPFKSAKKNEPAFLSDRINRDWWLFVNSYDQVQTLSVGLIETDFGLILRPRKKGYVMSHE
jgi:hypothetical protein